MRLVRLLAIGLMMSIVALWAGDVFDQRVWTILVASVVPTLVAIVVLGRRWYLTAPAMLLGVLASVAAAALLEGGGFDDVTAPFGPGLQRMLSTEWPSPVRPDLVATIVLILAVATAISAELAERRRLHLAPLAPIALASIAVIALSAPRGAAVGWPIALAAVAAAFAAIGSIGPLGDRLRLLRGERRTLAVLGIIAIVTGLFAAVISLSPRADPRATEDPDRTAALLDPIEATLALQRIDPPVVLHRIDVAGDLVPLRWRTAALEDYNGRRWSPDLSLRPIGRRLATADEIEPPVINADIEFLDDDLQLVPLPGPPVVVDAPIETDLDRTLVRLIDRPEPGTTVALTAMVEPNLAETIGEQIATREIDESASSLSDLAEQLATVDGDLPPTVLGRLRAIESTMREDYVLDPDAAGGGLQRALIERFMRETQQGNAEQFATGFVLVARSIGVDARVATGFVADASTIEDGTVLLSSADAAIWPEVNIGDNWVAFDPVPETALADATPPPAEPNVQSPAAPQPPIAPPPDDVEEAIEQTENDDTGVVGGVSGVVQIAVRVAAVGGIILLPVLLLIALIIGMKRRRRRRRLRGEPSARIRGAWQEATDHLVDAGLSIGPSMTNDEIAQAGRPHAPSATRELGRLATLSTAVTFGEPARPDLLADDAATCLEVVEEGVDLDRTWRSRVGRRLSLRSLRSRTRTPV